MRRLILAVSVGCTTSCFSAFDTLLPGNDPFSAGVRLSYVAESRTGSPLVEGVLTVTGAESGSFAGTWEAHRSPGSDTTLYVGGQLGAGTASGQLASDGWIRIVLNDGDSTTQVVASGSRDSLGYYGRWATAAPGGFRTGGAFVATFLH